MSIDYIDEKILVLLKKNSRQSISEIAQTVGRSRTVVASRIEQLEQRGEITGFTVTLKKKSISALFEIKLAAGKTCHDVVVPFKEIQPIINAWSVAGSSDLFILADFDEAILLNQARTSLNDLQSVLTVQTHVITYHFE
jgi:Lrp/AsnC family leucine-responsive transcriptional regulator